MLPTAVALASVLCTITRRLRGPRCCVNRSWFLWHVLYLNSLWPSGAIWRHRSWSILVQVMACYLAAPSHDLNQCLLCCQLDDWKHLPEKLCIQNPGLCFQKKVYESIVCNLAAILFTPQFVKKSIDAYLQSIKKQNTNATEKSRKKGVVNIKLSLGIRSVASCHDLHCSCCWEKVRVLFVSSYSLLLYCTTEYTINRITRITTQSRGYI